MPSSPGARRRRVPSPPPPVIAQRYEQHVPLDRLHPHPANPNRGDLDLLRELIGANGFAGAVLAQEGTGVIVDGEHRWKTALETGMTGLPVLWLDVDDDSRDRLLASLNEATRRGKNDEAGLVALLQGLAGTSRGLEGTAYTGEELDALIAGLNKASPLPEPGDAGTDDDLPERWGVVVECDNEDEQAELLAEFDGRGLKVRALIS